MNSSLVYLVPSILPFNAVQYKMLTASSSKGQKYIHSPVTCTEAQWMNLVWI